MVEGGLHNLYAEKEPIRSEAIKDTVDWVVARIWEMAFAICKYFVMCKYSVICKYFAMCKYFVMCKYFAICKYFSMCKYFVMCKYFAICKYIAMCKYFVMCKYTKKILHSILLLPYCWLHSFKRCNLSKYDALAVLFHFLIYTKCHVLGFLAWICTKKVLLFPCKHQC